MKFIEMKQVVYLLSKEWDLGKKASGAKGNTCAWIYLFEILEESEKIVIENENGSVIGICGYSKWNSKKHKIRKNFFKFLKTCLIHSPFIKNKKAIYKYNEDYDYLPKELDNYFDGEISILIVDKNYRGKNFGKKLLLKTFELAKKDNVKKINILSDESCNFNFYEKLGCKNIYETIIFNGEPDEFGNISNEKGFVYEKVLIEDK